MRARTRKRVKITRVYARARVYTHIHIYIYTYTRALVLAWFQGAEDRPPLVRESAALFFFFTTSALIFPGLESRSGLEENAAQTLRAFGCLSRAARKRGRRRGSRGRYERGARRGRRLQRSRAHAFVYRAAYGGSMWLVTRQRCAPIL